MSFQAINSVEADLRDKAEQHTLELQLEDAFKLYQSALQAQHDSKWDEATFLYDQLLSFDVLQLSRKQNSRSANRLKGIAFRNYALLKLKCLQESLPQEESTILDLLTPIVDKATQALQLCDCSRNTMELIYALSMELGYYRIARLILESIIESHNERLLSIADAALSSNHNTLLRLNDKNYLFELNALLNRIGGVNNLPKWVREECQSVTLPVSLHWIGDSLGQPFSLKRLIEFLNTDCSLDVIIIKPNWVVVAAALEEALSSISNRRKKGADIYSCSNRPVLQVRFVFPHGEALVVDDSEAETDVNTPLANNFEDSLVIQHDHQQFNALIPSDPIDLINLKVSETTTESTEVNGATNTGQQQLKHGDAETSPSKRQSDSASLRSSKRVRAHSEYSLGEDFSQSDEAFAHHISSYLELCDLSYESVVPVFRGDKESSANLFLYDLKDVLAIWDDDESAIFLSKGAPDINVSQPVMQMLDFAALGDEHVAQVLKLNEDGPELSEFFAKVGVNTSHIQQSRYRFIEALLTSRGSPPLLISRSWPDELLVSVQKLVFDLEPIIYARVKNEFSHHTCELALAVYELYLDEYLDVERRVRSCETELPKVLSRKRDDLLQKVLLWRGVSGDAAIACPSPEGYVRHTWISIFFDQLHGDVPSGSMRKFELLKEYLIKNELALEIEYPNYKNIPTASVNGAETQIAKFRAASIFAKVFSREEPEDGDYLQPIALLEAMLMPEIYTNEIPEHAAIAKFLKSASLQFRLSLWYILLEKYEKVGEKQKSHDGLIRILMSSIEELTDPKFALEPKVAREKAVLQTFTIAYDIAQRLAPLLLENESLIWVDQRSGRQILESIITLLRALHVFMLNDNAVNNNLIQAPQHHTWDQVQKKFRELTVYYWLLFYLYFRFAVSGSQLTPELSNDVLSIIHEQLGIHGYCSMLDGLFLDTNINEMLRLDWPESEADMIQCLHCRYGIQLSNDKFSPYNHHAIHTELDRHRALRLTKFIMRMILSKKNLTHSLMRTDVRQVVDLFYEALGKPDTNKAHIKRNQDILNHFLAEQELTCSFIKRCWRGNFELGLSAVEDETASLVGSGGFYFVMGLVHLSQYRVRKKSNILRKEDLDNAISFFEYDLICNTNRYESWLSLAYCYNYYVETTLMWTAEALYSGDSHALLVTHARSAVKTAFVALSELLRKNRPSPLNHDYRKTLDTQFWPFFGQLLLDSASSPLDMCAYERPQRLVFRSGSYSNLIGPSVSQKTILKLARQAILKRLNERPNDWHLSYLLGTIERNLDMEPHNVMNRMLVAQKNRLTDSKEYKNQELMTEPNLAVIIFSMTYYLKGLLNHDEALHYLVRSGFAPNVASAQTSRSDSSLQLFDAVVSALQALQAHDKKHWLHRPVFWLAWIFDHVYHDTKKAQDVLGSLFTINSSSKAPLQIWKLDNERPGQHFVYMHDYIMYYADLAYENEDDASLSILARKTRRFGASMTDHEKVWEHICSLIIDLTRKILSLPNKFADRYTLPEFFSFELRSKKLETWMEKQALSENPNPWIFVLDFAVDLRRTSGNYGPTSMLDDLVACVYMQLYVSFEPYETDPLSAQIDQGSPSKPYQSVDETGNLDAKNDLNGSNEKKLRNKKIVRRNIIQRAQQSLRPIQQQLSRFERKSLPRVSDVSNAVLPQEQQKLTASDPTICGPQLNAYVEHSTNIQPTTQFIDEEQQQALQQNPNLLSPGVAIKPIHSESENVSISVTEKGDQGKPRTGCPEILENRNLNFPPF